MAKPGPRPSARSAERATDDVRSRLIEAAVVVLARDGFAHASARTIAAEAGGANGLIYYHFGSMDQLLTETARTLADRGVARIKAGLGGDESARLWPERLGDVIRAEASGDDGQAVLELMVGARTSPVLAAEIRSIIDDAVETITDELAPLFAATPLGSLLPPTLIAEVSGATFLGLEVLIRSGRDIDVERLAAVLAAGVAMLTPKTA